MKNTFFYFLIALFLLLNACQETEILQKSEFLTLREALAKDKAFKNSGLALEEAIQNVPEEEHQNLANFIHDNQELLDELYASRSIQERQVKSFKTSALAVGESMTFPVYANDFWTNSGLQVQQGESYTFSASGTWTDLFFTCDADGYTNWYIALYNGLKRMQGENFFKLIGAINQNNLFAIGKSNTITIQNNGELNLFANDANGFYFNNFGHVHLTITRNL